MRSTPIHVVVALLTGACLSSSGDARGTPPPGRPVSADVDAGSPPAPPDAGQQAPLPSDVAAARSQLLDFEKHGAKTLDELLRVLDAFEQPVRYEEHGEVGGRRYFYARLRYERVGITVHHDGKRVTNVEQNGHLP